MRWLKHMTATRDDEKVAKLIELGGHAAYGLWWMVLETVAGAMAKDGQKCSLTYPISKWATCLSLRGSLVMSSLSRLAVTSLVTIERHGTDVTVTIPNLLKYRDEWSSRSGVAPESLGSKKQQQIQKQIQNASRQAKSTVVVPDVGAEPEAAACLPAHTSESPNGGLVIHETHPAFNHIVGVLRNARGRIERAENPVAYERALLIRELAKLEKGENVH